jgi:hypothetical protein
VVGVLVLVTFILANQPKQVEGDKRSYTLKIKGLFILLVAPIIAVSYSVALYTLGYNESQIADVYLYYCVALVPSALADEWLRTKDNTDNIVTV